MTDGPNGSPGLADLVRDWITIWQSELSAAATDQERAHAWSSLVAMWADGARAASAFLPNLPVAHDAAAGLTPRQPSAGPAPAPAAPDARDAAIEKLARRVEELERRLAAGDGPKDR